MVVHRTKLRNWQCNLGSMYLPCSEGWWSGKFGYCAASLKRTTFVVRWTVCSKEAPHYKKMQNERFCEQPWGVIFCFCSRGIMCHFQFYFLARQLQTCSTWEHTYCFWCFRSVQSFGRVRYANVGRLEESSASHEGSQLWKMVLWVW